MPKLIWDTLNGTVKALSQFAGVYEEYIRTNTVAGTLHRCHVPNNLFAYLRKSVYNLHERVVFALLITSQNIKHVIYINMDILLNGMGNQNYC